MAILNEFKIVFNHLEGEIDQIKLVLQQLADSRKRLDEVEQQLMPLLMRIGKAALEDFIQSAGDGDVGEQISASQTNDNQRLKRLEKKRRSYRSVFGVIEINRYVYAVRKKQKCQAPLDQRLGLPQAETSYLLEKWMSSLACYLPYETCSKWLERTFGIGGRSTTIERRVGELAKYCEPFRQQDKETFDQGCEELDDELIVVQADGKGVPIRTSWEQTLLEKLGKKPHLRHHKNDYPRSKRRRLRGDQAKSQQATIGACYSIARNIRTTDQALGLTQATDQDSPQPKNKRLFGELNRIHQKTVSRGAVRVFEQLAEQVSCRSGNADSPPRELVCIMDGAVSLWKLKEKYLPDAVAIIDIYHASERLWDVAHCLEKDGSQAAEDRVTHWLRMLFDGKVDCVRGLFVRLLKKESLSQSKQSKIQEAIGYFKTNRKAMQYDLYLARGYPIGSGVIEGACKHVIGNRFCGSGMRWEHQSAQSLLHLRTIELSKRWDQFIQYRILQEQELLYRATAA